MMLNSDEIVELQQKYRHLINYQADDPTTPIDPLTYIDSNGDTLLHIAAMLGDERTVTLLLKAGQDANCLGDMGYTALHYAQRNGNRAVAEILVANGASTNIKNEFGQTPN